MPAWQCLPGELAVCKDEALQSDGELHVTAAHHVLYLEVLELRLQTSHTTLVTVTNITK